MGGIWWRTKANSIIRQEYRIKDSSRKETLALIIVIIAIIIIIIVVVKWGNFKTKKRGLTNRWIIIVIIIGFLTTEKKGEGLRIKR